jgi:metallo-beta-lactamase family protein
MKITFLGAVEEVTGSKYLIEHEDIKILVDCGLFQGEKELRKRNWDPFPIDPSSINAIVLTHAHVDHIGYIPLLVKNGFRGKIYSSRATYALSSILLIDCGNIFENDAKKYQERAIEEGKSSTAVPLYTILDAERALTFFHPIDYNKTLSLSSSLSATLIPSGHIPGSSFVIISDGKQTLTFSGDLGRPKDPIMKAPTHLTHTDYLVLESTYGDRLHEHDDPIKSLGDAIQQTATRGGVIIIPSFAVARTQLILYYLYQLKQAKMLPEIPIFLDSPMAIKVTDLYSNFLDEHKLSAQQCTDIFSIAAYTPGVEESKHIDQHKGPCIIIAGSGMAEGGRVLHHLEHFISDARNAIVFVGYQANATHGQDLIKGAKEIELYGKSYKVNATIKTIGNLSAHADYHEILEWLSYFENKPKKVFITHGELASAQSLKKKIEERYGWTVVVPKYLESFDLE